MPIFFIHFLTIISINVDGFSPNWRGIMLAVLLLFYLIDKRKFRRAILSGDRSCFHSLHIFLPGL